MVYKNKRFVVAGVSRSGVSAAEFLLKRGAKVILYDDALAEGIAQLKALGAEDASGRPPAEVLEHTYCVVTSPGIPDTHPLLECAAGCGVPVISEIELAAAVYKGTVAAVTGTNGKTTTVSLLNHILKAAGVKSFLCGNIGVPFTHMSGRDADTVACLEVSSFQLEHCEDFKPYISVVLNVTPDHLSRHGSMDAYAAAKKRIMRRQGRTEYAVLNFDDAYCRAMFGDIKTRVVWFSDTVRVAGAYIEDDFICWQGEQIIHTGGLRLPGKHNLRNALAAVCAAKLLGVETYFIATALKSFKGVPHRIERVGLAGGKTFYNDSKSTNPDSAVTAAAAMDRRTVMLLGGSDKQADFCGLFGALKQNPLIVCCVLYGETLPKLREGALAAGFTDTVECADFESAVTEAAKRCPKGGAVLLSPACASFDEFRDYEQRGDRFKQLTAVLRARSKGK